MLNSPVKCNSSTKYWEKKWLKGIRSKDQNLRNKSGCSWNAMLRLLYN